MDTGGAVRFELTEGVNPRWFSRPVHRRSASVRKRRQIKLPAHYRLTQPDAKPTLSLIGENMATIRQQSGKWQVRVQRKGYPTQSKTFTNKADAIKWGKQIEVEMERGAFQAPDEGTDATLADVLTRYLSEITPSKKGAKVEGYRIAVLQRSNLAKQALARIRSIDIARYRDERSKTVAANTIKNELNTLSAVFEAARLEWGMNVTNPVRGLKRPNAPGGRERRLLSGEEERLLEACKASKAWYLCTAATLAIETGMRLGEIASLEWQHIDLTKRVARLSDTKNGTARSVPLSSRACQALSALPRNLSGKLFPVCVDAIKQAFRAAVARARKTYEQELAAAGIGPEALAEDPLLANLHFHDLRHEAVSRLFELGLGAMEVASISGHKTLAMLKRYTHLRAEDLALKLG